MLNLREDEIWTFVSRAWKTAPIACDGRGLIRRQTTGFRRDAGHRKRRKFSPQPPGVERMRSPGRHGSNVYVGRASMDVRPGLGRSRIAKSNGDPGLARSRTAQRNGFTAARQTDSAHRHRSHLRITARNLIDAIPKNRVRSCICLRAPCDKTVHTTNFSLITTHRHHYDQIKF